MTRVSRAKEKGETHGFMEVLVDAAAERVIGGTIFGVDGDEAIHTVLAHMDSGAPYRKLRDAMHIHPTVSELIPTLLQSLEPLDF